MTTTAPLSTRTIGINWNQLDAAEASIKFQNVIKRYDDGTVAVNDVSFTCPAQKITVFVGPSGCGKTTSLRMINRMIAPTDGQITIGDLDTSRLEETALRRHMGYVIQNAGLFPHRRIVDNIATVPRLLGLSKHASRERAMELMHRVGLDERLARRFPHQLSGGQQQRVGVARALASDPPVLLMDEPFSAIDPVVRGNLQNELLRLQSEIGKTIVLVTHDIDEAVHLADQIVVFQTGGTVAQVGSPEELLVRPANDFVRSFIGRDAGLRWLSLLPAKVVTPRASRETRDVAWQLELSDTGAPRAWVPRAGAPSERLPATAINLSTATVRDLLDLVVRAELGTVVSIDHNGSFSGVVDQRTIDDAIAQERGQNA